MPYSWKILQPDLNWIRVYEKRKRGEGVVDGG